MRYSDVRAASSTNRLRGRHQRSVMLTLIGLSNDDGEVRRDFTQAELADHLGIGERTLRDALTDLIEMGALGITPQYRNGHRVNDHYRVLKVPDDDPTVPAFGAGKTDAIPATVAGMRAVHTGKKVGSYRQQLPRKKEEPLRTLKSESDAAASPTGFDAEWQEVLRRFK